MSWTVIADLESRNGKRFVRARCECGREKDLRHDHLKSGRSRSCGCLSVAVARETHTRHGEVLFGDSSVEYSCWRSMRARCRNEKHPQYDDYGGRGIKVCARWEVFEHFLADMGRRPGPGLSINRIDNNGGYEPTNCEWATAFVQRKNQRPRRAHAQGAT